MPDVSRKAFNLLTQVDHAFTTLPPLSVTIPSSGRAFLLLRGPTEASAAAVPHDNTLCVLKITKLTRSCPRVRGPPVTETHCVLVHHVHHHHQQDLNPTQNRND